MAFFGAFECTFGVSRFRGSVAQRALRTKKFNPDRIFSAKSKRGREKGDGAKNLSLFL